MRALVAVLLLGLGACKKEQPPPAAASPAPAPEVVARPPQEAPKDKKATLFEATWWGQTEAELLAVYGKDLAEGEAERFASAHPPLIILRKVDGLELEVALHAKPPDGLQLVEVSGLARYGDDGDDCKSDASKLEQWLRPRAGSPEYDFGSWKWATPTSAITVFCDEGLVATFEPPRVKAQPQ